MTLRATEGFDHYSSIADMVLRVGALQWTTTGGASWSTTTPGRGGYGACLSSQNGTVQGTFNVNLVSGFFGFGLTFGTATSSMTLELLDPISLATQLMFVFVASTGMIQLYRNGPTADATGRYNYGGAVIASSEPNAFNASVWAFYEVGATIDPAAGSLSLRVNGSTVLSYSGNTQNSGNSSFGGVRFSCNPNNDTYLQLDDFRYNDTTVGPGTYPCNGFMGDLRVVPLYPTANSAVTWTPLTGENWQEVSETAFDGDTSYNATSTVGDEDLFTMGSVPSAATVIAVSLIGAYRSGDATAHTLTQQLSVGGTDHAGAVQTLALGYQFVSDVFPVNPTTAASWAAADVNTMLAGYKVAS